MIRILLLNYDLDVLRFSAHFQTVGQEGEVFSAKLRTISGFGDKGEVSMNLFLKSGATLTPVNIDGKCPASVLKRVNSPATFNFFVPDNGTYWVVIAGADGVKGTFVLTVLTRFGLMIYIIRRSMISQLAHVNMLLGH
jgi:hypothetical protein